MRCVVMRVWPIGLLLAVLLVATGLGLFGPSSDAVSQTSAIAAAPQPTPTYISELAPAVMQPPREPAGLPSTGAGVPQAVPWPKVAGLGLALLGALLVHAALTLRPHRTA